MNAPKLPALDIDALLEKVREQLVNQCAAQKVEIKGLFVQGPIATGDGCIVCVYGAISFDDLVFLALNSIDALQKLVERTYGADAVSAWRGAIAAKVGLMPAAGLPAMPRTH